MDRYHSSNISDDEETPILTEHTIPSSEVKHVNTFYFYKLVFFASLGGFLFGYDTGVISGAMIPLKRVFDLSDLQQEVIVAVAIGGAALGALVSAILNERYGRRAVILIASALFTIGSIALCAANGFAVLVIGRIVVGLGIGLASMTVPIYIAEAAPPLSRGKVVLVYQFLITAGQFIASVMNGVFTYFEHDSWRYMLGVSGVPSVIMFIGCLFMPESPRWLVQKGKINEASLVLSSIRGTDDCKDELDDIIESNTSESNITFKESLVKMIKLPSARHALILGCGLQFIQQMSAINTVMYYSASIIELAGVRDMKMIIWLAAVVALGNCVFTIISFFLVERVGRRKLTLLSVFGVIIALCILASTFYILDHRNLPVTVDGPTNYTQSCDEYKNCHSCVKDNNCGFCYVNKGFQIFNGSCLSTNIETQFSRSSFCNKTIYDPYNNLDVHWTETVCPSQYAWLAVLAMIIYLATFAIGLGPMPWTINAEIYPLWARNAGQSAATATNWITNMFISLTFLSLISIMSRPGVFIFYALFTFFGMIFLYLLLPETKGKKLEEIEQLFGRVR